MRRTTWWAALAAVGVVAAGALWTLPAVAEEATLGAAVVGVADGDGAFPALGTVRRALSSRLFALHDLLQELALTPEQKARLKAAARAHRAEGKATLKGLVAGRRAMRAAVLAERPDAAAIRAAAADLGRLLGDAAVRRSAVAGEVRSVLTPTQLARVQAFLTENDQAVDQLIEDLPAKD